jgi:hypothetical protein
MFFRMHIVWCILPFISVETDCHIHNRREISDHVTMDVRGRVYLHSDNYMFFTVLPSSLRIENVTPANRLLGTEGQDLIMSCKAVGGKPTPNVVLIIDEQTVANQTQSVQHTLTTINRSYDHKIVTCQASNPAYSQNSLTDSAVIYLNCK